MKKMKFNVEFDGILKDNGYKAWDKQVDLKFKSNYAQALKKSIQVSKDSARHDIASKFKSKNKGFINGAVRMEVYDKRKDLFATGHIYSKIPYFHVFETGATIRKNKKLIIPITNTEGKRRNRKQFKILLEDLFKTKNFFFRKINGTTILFAKVTKSNTKMLRVEKKFYNRNNVDKINGKTIRKATYKRIKEGDFIPVGVCLDEVRLKKRYNIDESLHNKTLENTIKFFEQIFKKS